MMREGFLFSALYIHIFVDNGGPSVVVSFKQIG